MHTVEEMLNPYKIGRKKVKVTLKSGEVIEGIVTNIEDGCNSDREGVTNLYLERLDNKKWCDFYEDEIESIELLE